MDRNDNELKEKHQKETKNSQELQRETDRLNQAKQTTEKVIKSMRNLTTLRLETVLDKENNLNYLQKSLEKERSNTNHEKR